MFHIFFSQSHLALMTIFGFFSLFLFRHLCVKRKLFIVLYHIIVGSILFVAAIGGGSVQNDAYIRLEKFRELEKNHKLIDAKENTHHDDSMFSIDLKEFNDSHEFKAYLKKNDATVDKAEALFLGWMFLFLSDIALLCVYIFRYAIHLLKKHLLSQHSQ